MTNNEIVQARYRAIIDALEAQYGEVEVLTAKFTCNGCRGEFDPDSDFTFWKIGANGENADFCPACWT